ncbi:MAG: ATP synthase F1 subunit gamma [Clostridia bacterium]|nr:ATP synthase F1 subunit gamma [Clostridia bacterium]
MASMRDIKRRIKSVNSTQQITKAMNLVASSKLNRAKSRFNDTKPFFEATKRVIANVVKGSKGVSSVFMQERKVSGKTLVVVIAGDRGLCGGYNSNVCKAAMEIVSQKESSAVITAGNKAREFFKHKGVEIADSFRDISEKPGYVDAFILGAKIIDMYEKGEADEVYFVYTEFITTLTSEPKVIKLLPLDPKDFENDNEPHSATLTIYEPDEEAVLNYVIPKYINTVIYGGMVESAVCELSSRMTAMDSATENATEMIEHLNLVYNRVRQGAITQEITEIVSGSNALE